VNLLAGIQVENGTHWMLLCREADQSGLDRRTHRWVRWIPALAKAIAPDQAQLVWQQDRMQAMQFLFSDPKTKEIFEKNPQLIQNQQLMVQLLGQMLSPSCEVS